LVHVSTDFVFDGDSSRPYCPEDFTNPLNAYGLSKLDGEMKVRSVDAAALIVRTSWLYAAKGKNFVNTMLRLLSERDEVRVVMDQIGTPTYARNLAQALWVLAGCEAVGTYHYSDEGVASWYDFAVAVSEEALEAGLFRKSARVIPVTTANYPTSAKRPRFSVLEKSKTRNALGDVGQHWRAALREMLKEACLDE
jgi:dTDP-4-dehydrorhamnose reductase